MLSPRSPGMSLQLKKKFWKNWNKFHPCKTLQKSGTGRAASYAIHQEFGTEEADASENLHYFGEVSHVKNRLGQLYVAKVARTLCHVASTRLAPRAAVNDSLAWIHQTT